MLDLKIINARIVDGTGAPAYTGEIGVKDGSIAAVGNVSEEAAEIVDAEGRVVSPGFIDVHSTIAYYDSWTGWHDWFHSIAQSIRCAGTPNVRLQCWAYFTIMPISGLKF